MYNKGNERQEGKKMNYGAVISGKFVYARRNDGHEFVGLIESVRALAKGTLVVVVNWDSEWERKKYESFYLENCSDWTVYDSSEEFQMAVC